MPASVQINIAQARRRRSTPQADATYIALRLWGVAGATASYLFLIRDLVPLSPKPSDSRLLLIFMRARPPREAMNSRANYLKSNIVKSSFI